ncbi:peptidoglycan DD-metalloendopeptidase family protein [Nocardioides caeni]
MRFFPSASWLRRTLDRLPVWARPEWIVTMTAALVVVAGLAVPLAVADDRDDLENKQDQVQGQINSVQDDIEEASGQVAAISRRLARVRDKLRTARDRLATAQGELADARAVSSRLATQLTKAEERLEVAREKLAQARIDVADQRDEGRDTIIRRATGGNAQLDLIAAYAQGETMEDLLVSQSSAKVITGRQQQTLDSLVEAEEILAEHRAEVRSARDEVADAKTAADDNVRTVARLVRHIAAGKNRVAALASSTENARAAVVRARARDRAALKRLEKREARIKSQILALSRRQGGSYNGDTGGLLHRPADGPVTSPFGYRTHPIYGYYGLHNGTDFGAGCGSSLWAGESGTVINTYYDEVYGNRLYLAIGKVNGASITLVYNHLSSYAVGQGAHVKRGQVVGYVGSTGWSTGCHLHFTVLRNGEPVDPMGYM